MTTRRRRPAGALSVTALTVTAAVPAGAALGLHPAAAGGLLLVEVGVVAVVVVTVISSVSRDIVCW
ncbi:hypothetical protein [Nonomuraea antimicrobica]|uniref:hypothetical protein n=1 Tax=Nonomuraea antimicrobica TaxID=561173 RepID=UPI0031E5BC55